MFGQSGAGNNWAKGHYTEGTCGAVINLSRRRLAVSFGRVGADIQVPSWSTRSSTSSDEKLRAPTASRVSRSPTLLEEEPEPVWEHC